MDGFFGIGIGELVLIAIVALIVLGPERLPGAFREIAKFIRQVRNLSNEFTSQFGEEFKALEDLDPRRMLKEAIDSIDEEEEAKAKEQQKKKPTAKPASGSKPTTTKPATTKSTSATTSKTTPKKTTTSKPATAEAADTAVAATTTATGTAAATTDAPETAEESVTLSDTVPAASATTLPATSGVSDTPEPSAAEGRAAEVDDAQPTAESHTQSTPENQIAPPKLVEAVGSEAQVSTSSPVQPDTVKPETVQTNGRHPTIPAAAQSDDTNQGADITEAHPEPVATQPVAVIEKQVEHDGERTSVAEVEEKQA